MTRWFGKTAIARALRATAAAAGNRAGDGVLAAGEQT